MSAGRGQRSEAAGAPATGGPVPSAAAKGVPAAGAPAPGAPLAGVRVVVTRAGRQAGELAAALAAAGAAVEPLPLLEVVPPADPSPLARAVSELPLYDWVVFTSTNAVHALLPQTPPAGLPARLRLAAVGAATAAALRGLGA